MDPPGETIPDLLTPEFDCRRMVREYMTELYEPAHSQHVKLLRGDYSLVREKAQWNTRIRQVWDRVRFVDSVSGPAGSITSGKPVKCAPPSTWLG